MPLWDTVDDGDRFRDVLPNVLEAIGRALAAHPCGRVFIHCQQGWGLAQCWSSCPETSPKPLGFVHESPFASEVSALNFAK